MYSCSVMRRLFLAACLGFPAPAAAAGKEDPSSEAMNSVTRARECVAGLEEAVLGEARERARRCRAAFPPLSEAFSRRNVELAAMVCNGSKGELRRYWRCRQAATDSSGDEFCAWRLLHTAEELSCRDGYPPSSCIPGNNQSWGSFARLGRAVRLKEPGAAALCVEAFGPLLGADGPRGCELLATRGAAAACALPGFFKPDPKKADCRAITGKILGTFDCSRLKELGRSHLGDFCREMRLYHQAGGKAAACGEGKDAAVCRALITRDIKDCEPAAEILVAAACDLTLEDLTRRDYFSPRRKPARDSLGPLAALAPAWRRCRALHGKARDAVNKADSSLPWTAEERRKLDWLENELSLFAPESHRGELKPFAAMNAPAAYAAGRED